jgi:hypothetical protein
VSYGYAIEMENEKAELAVNDLVVDAGDVVASANLRLKLFCNFVYFDRGNGLGAYPPALATEKCVWIEPDGLNTKITDISVTCDKTIANIEAGKDLLSIMKPLVYVKGQYELTVPEWIDALNRGYFDSYARDTVNVGLTYEFDFALIPYYVTVPEDDYVFTLTMNLGGIWDYQTQSYTYARTYARTFPSIHLK